MAGKMFLFMLIVTFALVHNIIAVQPECKCYFFLFLEIIANLFYVLLINTYECAK